jgi:hypothetical protein
VFFLRNQSILAVDGKVIPTGQLRAGNVLSDGLRDELYGEVGRDLFFTRFGQDDLKDSPLTNEVKIGI